MQREDILVRFKERMRAGKVLVGMTHASGSEALVEVMAGAGFDFVVIDTEHTSYSMAMAESFVRAAEAAGIVAFIRVIENNPYVIMQAMETGAQGILLPHTMSQQDCRNALAAMRYRPQGIRGKNSYSRAAHRGLVDWRKYKEWANTQPLLVPIIEDKEAVEVMEDIFCAPGLELVSIGPGDLSESYDAPGRALRAEPVMSALERAIRFCTPRNIAVMTIPTPDLSNEWALEIVEKGARVIWYGGDIMNIGRYFKRIASLKDPRGSSG